MEINPYLKHNAPPIMGLTSFYWKDFNDLLVMANDKQLEVMQRQIAMEKRRRWIQ